MLKTIDTGNNETLSHGVIPERDGTFTVLTLSRSKRGFKTEKGANACYKRWTGDDAPGVA